MTAKLAAASFTTVEEVVSIACPAGLKNLEVWHKAKTYFDFRGDAPGKRDGISNPGVTNKVTGAKSLPGRR